MEIAVDVNLHFGRFTFLPLQRNKGFPHSEINALPEVEEGLYRCWIADMNYVFSGGGMSCNFSVIQATKIHQRRSN